MKKNKAVLASLATVLLLHCGVSQASWYLNVRVDDGKLTPVDFTTSPVNLALYSIKNGDVVSVDAQTRDPYRSTPRFECQAKKAEKHCVSEQSKKEDLLPSCAAYENAGAGFVKVSNLKSDYGDTPEQRADPNAWRNKSVAGKAGTVAVTGVVGAFYAVPLVAMGAFMTAAGAVMTVSGCGDRLVGTTKWVEFDYDDFKIKADALLNAEEVKAGLANAQGVTERLQSTSAQLTRNLARDLNAEMAKYEKYSKAGANPFVRPFSFPEVKPPANVPVSVDMAAFESAARDGMQSQYEARLKEVRDALPGHVTAWRTRYLESQQREFDRAATSAAMTSFINRYEALDEAGLVPKAKVRQKELAQEERLALERRRKEQQEAEAQARKELAEYRASIKGGSETNCGPVVEVKSGMALVSFPVQGYGNTHWLRIAELFPPFEGCRFINGRYAGR